MLSLHLLANCDAFGSKKGILTNFREKSKVSNATLKHYQKPNKSGGVG
jgi:hypothetical protein